MSYRNIGGITSNFIMFFVYLQKKHLLKKFLIIRFSSIGDIVLTTPVVRCLKKSYPEAEIHYVTKKSFVSVLEHNPYISKIHAFDGDFKKLARKLTEENFDYIVDLHHSLRSHRLLLKLQKPSSSFRKLNFKKWLLVKAKLNVMPKIHVVDRYFEAVKKLGVKNDQIGADFFIDPNLDIPSHIEHFLHRSHVVALAVGSKHATKQLPVEKIRELLSLTTFSVILLGAKEDQEKANEVIPGFEDRVMSACGELSLQQSALTLSKCKALITGDTGMMHIAASLYVHIFSIWGNTVPAFGMYPYLPKKTSLAEIFEVEDLSCRPCSKLGFERCPKDHFSCMMNHDMTIIAHKISSYLLG